MEKSSSVKRVKSVGALERWSVDQPIPPPLQRSHAPTTPALPRRLVLDNSEHRGGVRRLHQGLAKFGPMQVLGNVGQRVQMFLKLPLWHQEKHCQVHRLIV